MGHGLQPIKLVIAQVAACSVGLAHEARLSSCQLCCLQRTALTDEDIKSEVEALERQGHRRLLVLTGEHPKYTFDQFLHVSRCN